MFDWTHDQLPQPTNRRRHAEIGYRRLWLYCLIADAIGPRINFRARARERLLQQAEAELLWRACL